MRTLFALAALALCVGSAHAASRVDPKAQARWLDRVWDSDINNPSVTINGNDVSVVLPVDKLKQGFAIGMKPEQMLTLFLSRYAQKCTDGHLLGSDGTVREERTVRDMNVPHQQMTVTLGLQLPIGGDLDAAAEDLQDLLREGRRETMRHQKLPKEEADPYVPSLKVVSGFYVAPNYLSYTIDYAPEKKASCWSPLDDAPTS